MSNIPKSNPLVEAAERQEVGLSGVNDLLARPG